MRGKAHSNRTRAQVVAALMVGGSVTEIVRQTGLPKQTVSEWKKQGSSREFVKVRTKKRDGGEFGALLQDYLEKSLEALTAQARQFGSKDWLIMQNARELAILHGQLCDRAIRILEAWERGRFRQVG